MAKEENQNRQFVYYWYKELGWSSNPFEYRYLFPISNYISGYVKERKKINYFIIEKDPICLIRGNDGFGKTTLILWLKQELMQYKDRVMIDYINKHIDFVDFIKMLVKPLLKGKEKLVINSNFFHIGKASSLIKDKHLRVIYESLYLRKKDLDFNSLKEFLNSRIKDKHLILLVDDVDELSEQNVKLIQMLVNNDLNLQLVLTSKKDLEILSKKNNILKIELDGLNIEDCEDMVKKRIEAVNGKEYEPLTNEQLKTLYQKCNKSPLLFLNLCKDKIIRITVNMISEGKKFEISEKTVSEISTKKKIIDNVEKVNNTQDKTYEIKVLNNNSNNNYEIKVVKPNDEVIPIKLEKERKEAVPIDKSGKSDNQEKDIKTNKEIKKGKK